MIPAQWQQVNLCVKLFTFPVMSFYRLQPVAFITRDATSCRDQVSTRAECLRKSEQSPLRSSRAVLEYYDTELSDLWAKASGIRTGRQLGGG